MTVIRAFEKFNENPILTTIETFPIDELKLPPIIVCPPKGHFTTINYDLETLKTHDEIENKFKSDLKEFASDWIFKMEYQSIIDFENKFLFQNKYKSWFDGYLKLQLSETKTKTEYMISTTESFVHF